jgi:conjugal transfer mating pair stabilization protein TraN
MSRFLAMATFLIFTFPSWAGSCAKTGSTCLDATPCKTISGVQVCLADMGEACWKYEDAYDCVSPTQVDDCQPLRDKGCAQIGSKCLTTNPDGTCSMYEQTYQCQTKPASTSTVMDCGTQTYCMSGTCFNTGHSADSDFAKVIASMEAAREAGTYMDPNSLQLFKGFDNRCTKGYFGLKNCCKTSGGGGSMSNAMMAVAAAGKTASFFGSPYMYDAMYASDVPFLMNRAIDAWSATAWTSSANFYGASFSYSIEGGLQFVSFDLTSFAFQVGMMILQDLLSCDQSEQILGMKRGQNLCHFTGSYCSQELNLGLAKICLETTESYCCFNSRLARIINEQGRGQVGKGWGSGESPDCSGFTPDQMQALDFSKMDLSEFYAEIQPKLPDMNALSTKNQQLIQQKVNNYYQQ